MADGKGCKCAAYDESECACDADWTPQELIDARAEIARLRLTDAEREAVAWAVVGTDNMVLDSHIYHTQSVAERNAAKMNERVVPLYRQPTLTDAEREAVEVAIRCVDSVRSWKAPQDALREKMTEHTARLRGLLDRTQTGET